MADDSTDSACGFILFILLLALFGYAAGGGTPSPSTPGTTSPSTPGTTGGTLLTHLSGQAAITIHDPPPDVPAGQQTAPAEMDMVFDAARTSVAVANFVPIVSPPFQTPQGVNTTTVSLQSGGNGSYKAGTGSMTISLVLFFDQSVDVIIIEEDSTLRLVLFTDQSGGSGVDAVGNVVLAGTGTFEGGIGGPLKGKTADVTLTGLITPHP